LSIVTAELNSGNAWSAIRTGLRTTLVVFVALWLAGWSWGAAAQETDVAGTIKQLESAGKLVIEGPDSAPRLYVFADPNCIFCNRFYNMAEPLVRAGKLQLRWAMVGFLKPTSMGRSAAILSADDPLQALRANEAKFNANAEQGGIAPVQQVDPSMQALINRNFTAMQAVGGTGTPTLLYRSDKGDWAVRVGLPPKAWLNSYAGG